ncbi:MAG TPA: calcium-transporting P-type ATPase, PMR1-type [Bacteroidales bacterium]|jgi:Ca2+-transporting ATPase|nr:calcium-transporting P-type ATPase, PMR1-type [Bacteroidales bacterium]
MDKWWFAEADIVASLLGTDIQKGLSPEEISVRQEKYGPNQLTEKKGRSAIALFLDQFKDFMIWVLIGAALVSGFLKEWVDAIAIICIVILNAILGFIQEYRAEKSLAALRKLSSPTSKVIRNGHHMVIPSNEIVPGDLVEMEAGDYVPADSRIVYATGNTSTHEASLTGESTSVNKTASRLDKEDVSLADRSNMLFMGTSVVSGKARALITETGMKTELGKIAGMIQEIEDTTTPLQQKLKEFGKIIIVIVFALVGLIFLIGYLRGEEIIGLFLTSVSLAVAAIPEGLPAVVTIALALGVQRMVKRNCIIRKLPSVETLGSTSVICSDKTGTLTKNEMTVQSLFHTGEYYEVSGIGYAPSGEFTQDGQDVDLKTMPGLSKLISGTVLCNGAQLIKEGSVYKVVGDPTEGALLTMAGKAGMNKKSLESEYPFVEEIPFDSERKQMTIIRRHENKYVAFVKGAPDVLIANCTRINEDGQVINLDQSRRDKIIRANGSLADRAMRVLAVAYREFDNLPINIDAASVERELTFLGLVAMIDPPRPEVKIAMKDCRTAGIRSVMITGDHKNTAVAIARDLGFYSNDSMAFTGEELDHMSQEEFAKHVDRTVVYARVSPEHKLRIVKAWQEKGHVVAMTGDGVNDAPAVKEADIGVAMGITGTDVTKEVSEMVITDDNFASIVNAVEEGRGIYDNIRKFIHYLLSCNVGEILVMFVASLVRLPVPLLPIHILWVNLVTDGLPALALGVDPIDRDIMKRQPRPKNESVLTRKMGTLIFLQGAFIAFCSLLAFYLVYFVEDEGIERARTASFIVLACSQLFHSYNCRSNIDSIFSIGFLSNKNLVYATFFSFLLQMAVVYIPVLQTVFKTQPLGWFDWVMVLIISSFPLLAMELVKLFMRLFRKSED